MRAVTAVDDAYVRRHELLQSWLRLKPSPETRRTIESALRCIVRCTMGLGPGEPADIVSFEWELLADRATFDEVVYRIRQQVADATARKYIASLRSLLRHLGQHDFARFDAVIATLDRTGTRSSRRHQPVRELRLDEEQLRRILRACHQDPNRVAGARDTALIALCAGTGARRSELVNVDHNQLDLCRRTVEFPTSREAERESQ
jgi:integrase